MREAELADTPTGKVAASEGWFVMNLAEAQWQATTGAGTWVSFEADGVPNQIGAGAHVLPPGETPGFYHLESDQEGFLVLTGECLLVVEGQERRMGPWDYFHCPPGTAHIMVGAGEAGCVLFMFGNRRPDERVEYLHDPAAARHGVQVTEPTDSPRQAYADRPRDRRAVTSPWPSRARS
jgi:uncharacterized cupin superfamily protein